MCRSAASWAPAGATIVEDTGEMKVKAETMTVAAHLRRTLQFRGFAGSSGPSQSTSSTSGSAGAGAPAFSAGAGTGAAGSAFSGVGEGARVFVSDMGRCELEEGRGCDVVMSVSWERASGVECREGICGA
jgi:hypothetical protein